MTTAYFAHPDFRGQLADELRRRGVKVDSWHGGFLAITEQPPCQSVWAANVWHDAERIEVESIGAAARALTSRQRNWAAFTPEHRGRARLIAERLPHVSAKPLSLGQLPPDAPLGSWTLLTPTTMLAAARCSSPFPNGEPQFIEDRDGPPNRAYLKLWEALARIRRFPQAGERCIDLGASPGGWTWSLAQLGANVLAIDKAPLDPLVDALPNVEWRHGSAFALEPSEVGPVDWVFSDVIAYPDRLQRVIERWMASGLTRNVVFTIKLQGETDHDALDRIAAIPGGRLEHLHHNKHEVTFFALDINEPSAERFG